MHNNNAKNYEEHLENYSYELNKYNTKLKEISSVIQNATGESISDLAGLKSKLSELILVDHEFVEQIEETPEPLGYKKFFAYKEFLYLFAYDDEYNIDYNALYRYDCDTRTWTALKIDFNVQTEVIQHEEEIYLSSYFDNNERCIARYNLETGDVTVIQRNTNVSWECGLYYNDKLYYFEKQVSNTNGLFNISTFDVNTKTFNFNISSNKGPYKFDTYAGYKYVYTESKYKLFILVGENMLLIYDVVTGTFQNINVGNFVKTKQIRNYSAVDGSAISMCSIKENWLFFPRYKKPPIFYNYVTKEVHTGLDKKIWANESQASFFYKNTIIIGGESGDYGRRNNQLIRYYPKLNFL